jgi:hypothetical protein
MICVKQSLVGRSTTPQAEDGSARCAADSETHVGEVAQILRVPSRLLKNSSLGVIFLNEPNVSLMIATSHIAFKREIYFPFFGEMSFSTAC